LTLWQLQSIVVLWRFFAAWLAGFEGANTVKNGKAQSRELQGSRTNSIKQTHFKPQPVTTCFWVERTASR
jgi:hypothetical protein